MSHNSPNPDPSPAGRRSPGLLLVGLVAVLFGLAMAAVGFAAAGRATAAAPGAEPPAPTLAAVAQVGTATPLPARADRRRATDADRPPAEHRPR